MEIAAIAGLALLALVLKGRASSSTPVAPSSQPPSGTAPNAAAGGAAPDYGKIGAGAISVVGAAIPLLKAAGVFTGGGTATAAGGSAAGGGGAAAEGGAAAGAEAAAEVGGLTLLESVGVAAIIVAIEILIAYVWFKTDMSAQTRYQYTSPNNLGRLSALWFLDESKTLESITDPGYASDPATGRPTTCYVDKSNPNAYQYVQRLSWGNPGYAVDHYTPVAFTLSATELLKLQRTCRYLAIQKIYAYNQSQFVFFENAYPGQTTNGNNVRGCSDDRFWSWVNQILSDEPWAQDCGYKTLATYAQLEATAKAYLGADFDHVVALWKFQGNAESLAVSAAVGWAWIGWPGDEQFNRKVVEWSGMGGKSLYDQLTYGGRWGVDAWNVQNVGFRWVAVDPVTRWGIDLQATRGNGTKVLYRPEALGLGSPTPPSQQPTTGSNPNASDTDPWAGGSGT